MKSETGGLPVSLLTVQHARGERPTLFTLV